MTEVLGKAAIATTVGQIKEISNRAQDRTETVRSISRRLQDLRMRLIGGNAESKAADDVPEPVRPDVDGLSHHVNVLGDLLVDIESDLSVLEDL